MVVATRSIWVLPLLLVGCGFEGSPGNMVDAPSMDARPRCIPELLDLCEQEDPTADLTITAMEPVDTAQDPRCRTLKQANGPDVCLLYFNNIEIQNTGTLHAFGARPLALVAKASLKVLGTLDVSSRRERPSNQPGAGSAPTLEGFCGFTAAPMPATGGGPGGAGGSFASTGGAGGVGNTDGAGGGTQNGPGGVATPALAEPPAVLRGGCNGQPGAGGAPPGGPPGLGGGAVYLSALAVQISGTIYAGGAGAAVSGREDGGGGGGSGGMIVVQSKSIDAQGASLIATGGGGAEGGDSNDDGAFGQDATTPSAAAGGDGVSIGGAGGAGSISTIAAAVTGGAANSGGGGGGGGAGFILFLGPPANITTATIVPAPMMREK